MKTNPVDSKASKPPFSRRRLFRWGIGFWIVVWIVSVCGCLSFYCNVKGCNRLLVGFGCGAVFCEVNESKAADNQFGMRDHTLIFSEYARKQIEQNPEVLIGIFARGGWHQWYHTTTVAFPITGFLWLWLVAGWFAEFRARRRPKAVATDSSGFPCSQHRVTSLTVALIVLAVATSYFAVRASQVREVSECCLNVRNIQQAVRGYQGTRGLASGTLPWDEIVNLDLYRKCPSGGNYQLSPVVPKIGEIAAKCTHPEHQRRLRSMDTSDW